MCNGRGRVKDKMTREEGSETKDERGGIRDKRRESRCQKQNDETGRARDKRRYHRTKRSRNESAFVVVTETPCRDHSSSSLLFIDMLKPSEVDFSLYPGAAVVEM